MTPRDSTKLVGETRDLLARNFSSGVAKSSLVLGDFLTQAAGKLMERDRGSVMRARDLILQREADWQKRLDAEYRDRFDKKIAGTDAGFSNTATFTLDSLKLMDDAEMQESILLGNLSARLKDACNMESYALTRRVEHLLERDLVTDTSNPLLPHGFCRAILNSLLAFEVPAMARYHMLAATETVLAGILNAAYKDANEFLVSHAVLIEIPISFGRGTRKPLVKPGASAAKAATAAAGKVPENVMDMIARLVAQNGAPAPAMAAQRPSSPAPGIPSAGGATAPTPAAAAAAAPQIDAQLMEALNQVAALSMLDAQTGTAAGRVAIGEQADAAPDNVLRYARNLLAPALQPAQNVIADVVTGFFDRLFTAPEMSPAIKTLLARLQVQTLKASIQNPTLLGDESHPLREFMDKMADVGIKHRHSLRAGEPTYEQLSSIVTGLCAQFDSDPDAISNANVELDVMLETEEAHAMDALNESVSKLRAAEEHEMARLLADYDVADRLNAGQYPAIVRDFASKHWQRLLVMDHLTQGEESEQRRQDLNTLDDLLWSVDSVSGTDDRQRLLKLIPQLAARLNDGLDRAGVAEGERGSFFQFLADCHMQALRPPPKPRVRRGSAPSPVVGDAKSVASNAKAVAVASSPAAVDPRTRLRKRTVDIERGQWIDLRTPDGAFQRCRLSWISPLMESLVFKNYDNNQALTLAPAEFKEKLKSGDIKLVEVGSLMQRSVDEAIQGLAAPPAK